MVDRGVLNTFTLTGTYTVNPNGTCSISLVLSNSGGTPELACALNSQGPRGPTGMQFLVTNPGPSGTDNSTNYAITGTAMKQSLQ